MDITKHRKEFEEIVKKYDFSSPEKAEEITKILTNQKMTSQEFASKYNMNQEEAKIFLSFIMKGIEFKEKHLDKKN